MSAFAFEFMHLVFAAASAQPTQLDGLAGVVLDVIEALGAVGVGLLVALENIAPPIPSEVILPLAGFLAGQGRLGLVWVIVAATLGSLVGALALYALGATIGPARLCRLAERVPLMERSDVERAEAWFGRHGGMAVLIGRCVPLVRSLVSIPAGVERMPLPRFCLYTVIGSSVWNVLLVLAGYGLGSAWQDVGEYSQPVNYAIYVLIGITIAFLLVRRTRRRRRGRDRRASAQRG